MEFKINPLAFSGIFPVPDSLVDDNIRLASVVQLKTLLYMLRHNTDSTLSCEKIAQALSLEPDDVKDSMIFWSERGILLRDGAEARLPEKSEAVPAPKAIETPKIEKRVAEIPISRPTLEQISVRCKECEEISVLFQEAQSALGKTIGYDGQSVLIMLYDSYGLPVEVILMAIEYALSQKKTSYSNIARIGKRWSEMEIDTLEAAMEYIEEHNVVDEVWKKLRSMTGITNRNPTEKQRKHLTLWVKTYGYDADIIHCAYEESIDRTGKMSFPYMDKIISTWHEKKVKNLSDIERERLRWTEKQQKRFASDKTADSRKPADASYDIDEYMKKAMELNYVKNSSEGEE